MFTANNLQTLLNAQPFVLFRLYMSDGGTVEVRSREQVLIGRHFAVVGILDPEAKDTLFDRWTVVWYMHVTRVEQLGPGLLPMTSPPTGPAGTPSPAPV